MKRRLVFLCLVLAGCASSLGQAGLMVNERDALGVKMITPNAIGRSCRSSVFGIPLEAGEPSLREALTEILARDGEADVVAGAEVRWKRVMTGVYNRRCVEVQGDLARVITTIRLPVPGHPAHH